jgi:hypothetical protein
MIPAFSFIFKQDSSGRDPTSPISWSLRAELEAGGVGYDCGGHFMTCYISYSALILSPIRIPPVPERRVFRLE